MQIHSSQFLRDYIYSFASWQQFISRTPANWARNDDVLFVLLYVLNNCRTATNVWRNVTYVIAIILTSHYVPGYQYRYGSQPVRE